MVPNSKSALVALLLAYRALGSPISTVQQGDVRSVIDALKAQVEEKGQSPQVIDDIESALKENGVLNAKTITALDEKLAVLTASKGLKPDEVAAEAIKRLTEKGVFDAANKQEGEEKAIYLTTEMVNKALAQGAVAQSICFPWPLCECFGQ